MPSRIRFTLMEPVNVMLKTVDMNSLKEPVNVMLHTVDINSVEHNIRRVNSCSQKTDIDKIAGKVLRQRCHEFSLTSAYICEVIKKIYVLIADFEPRPLLKPVL